DAGSHVKEQITVKLLSQDTFLSPFQLNCSGSPPSAHLPGASLGAGRIIAADFLQGHLAFSFAGEARQLVEAVNEEMKKEDVVTFYDFDQQAFLLALDLEETLGRIYSGSCRYHLVFLDENYRQKVWTKYERDVMTRPGRKNHIVPVILDDKGTDGTVGIPNTVGRIDLRDVWEEVQETHAISTDTVNTIRNRCVLPMLEKLDEN
ncbi:TIR domain-containing protein, partial [Desulfonatronum zhilinae]